MAVCLKKLSSKDIYNFLPLWKKQIELHHDLDPVYYSAYNEEKEIAYWENAIEINSPVILCAWDANKIVGFISFKVDKSEYPDTNITEYGEIKELFVDEEYRNRGIAAFMLHKTEAYFTSKHVKWIKLSSSTFNTKAKHFYEHIGYTNRTTLFYKEIK